MSESVEQRLRKLEEERTASTLRMQMQLHAERVARQMESMRAAMREQAMKAELRLVERDKQSVQKQIDQIQAQRQIDQMQQAMERKMAEQQQQHLIERRMLEQRIPIYLELERMGFKVWYDNRAADLTKEGMLKGIEEASAFVLFLSEGVLQRSYCQMEIRHALALKKPVVLLHESDARHGGFDFRAAHEAAEADLQELLDNTESLPFRRRGYERDGMLRTVIDHAGFKELFDESRAAAGSKAEALAAVPSELDHVALDALLERPVQAKLRELLLLQNDDERFTSACVLIHGMGGTGKTVAAVAVVREPEIRRHFRHIYWLAVGADAVDEQLKQLQATLYKKLTGKSMKSEEKDEYEWQQALLGAMAEKQRALVVLDDPWMPVQVRFLNPIDNAHSEHRLLVTTRIRDLVPKATRVELPLMGKDEAVALLLELANVEESSYLKDNPRAAWPPQAAYTIAAECGLLPITLTIAAQVVRAWGDGWESAVLPLLREKEGSAASTVQDRVIGAGLQALDKHEESAAVQDLFHMFAVTLEDFVHPIAVIELLWRSCCAPESESEEGSLTTRLKVRQWTQMLVDHSLLLGSSSEGIHLHDIVLQYLRKRLSAEEMRAEQKKVVEGMMAASRSRMAQTGRRLQDTGATARAFDGEEIDWYCGNVGSYHVKLSMDPSIAVTEDASIRRWLLQEPDAVLVRAVATAVGKEGLAALVDRFTQEGGMLEAAKLQWAAGSMSGRNDAVVFHDKALALIQEHGLVTPEAQQLVSANVKRVKEMMASNDMLKLDTMNVAFTLVWTHRAMRLVGAQLQAWDDDEFQLTDSSIFEFTRVVLDEFAPLLRQAEQEFVGARAEAVAIIRLNMVPESMLNWLKSDEGWGADRSTLMGANHKYSYGRHCELQRSMGAADFFAPYPVAHALMQYFGDVQQAQRLFMYQLRALHEHANAPSGQGLEVAWYLSWGAASAISLELSDIHALKNIRPALVKYYVSCGCTDTTECDTWFDGPLFAGLKGRQGCSRDGKHHKEHPSYYRAVLKAILALASAGPGSRVDMGFLDDLPPADDRRMVDCAGQVVSMGSLRVVIAEIMEHEGRTKDAVAFAQAELADEVRALALAEQNDPSPYI
eukprot:g662.t1